MGNPFTQPCIQWAPPMLHLQALERDVGEESGWKLVHGDVFRPPRRLELLSALLGTGVQLALLALAVILITIAGARAALCLDAGPARHQIAPQGLGERARPPTCPCAASRPCRRVRTAAPETGGAQRRDRQPIVKVAG